MKRFTDNQFELPTQLDGPSRGRRRWGAMFMSALIILGISLTILVPLGFFLPVVVLGGALFIGILGLHYLVWGRWMERILREEREANGEE